MDLFLVFKKATTLQAINNKWIFNDKWPASFTDACDSLNRVLHHTVTKFILVHVKEY